MVTSVPLFTTRSPRVWCPVALDFGGGFLCLSAIFLLISFFMAAFVTNSQSAPGRHCAYVQCSEGGMPCQSTSLAAEFYECNSTSLSCAGAGVVSLIFQMDEKAAALNFPLQNNSTVLCLMSAPPGLVNLGFFSYQQSAGLSPQTLATWALPELIIGKDKLLGGLTICGPGFTAAEYSSFGANVSSLFSIGDQVHLDNVTAAWGLNGSSLCSISFDLTPSQGNFDLRNQYRCYSDLDYFCSLTIWDSVQYSSLCRNQNVESPAAVQAHQTLGENYNFSSPLQPYANRSLNLTYLPETVKDTSFLAVSSAGQPLSDDNIFGAGGLIWDLDRASQTSQQILQINWVLIGSAGTLVAVLCIVCGWSWSVSKVLHLLILITRRGDKSPSRPVG